MAALVTRVLRRQYVVGFIALNVILIIIFWLKVESNRDGIESKASAKGIITVRLSDKLGTAMFQYAALLGIAAENNRKAAIPGDHFLREYFHISALHYEPDSVSSVMQIRENNAHSFDQSMENLQLRSNADVIELTGTYQSWLYFNHVHHVVMQEFQFRDHILFHAEEFLEDAVTSAFGEDMIREEVMIVGVHVRHRDMCSDENRKRGFAAADITYIVTAIAKVAAAAAAADNHKHMFVIVTDDKPFVQDILPSLHKHKHVISSDNSDAEDLAILAACDDAIITTGAFGWWGACLCDGQTAYYEPFALPGSELEKHFVDHDYFLPAWVGLTGKSPSGGCASLRE